MMLLLFLALLALLVLIGFRIAASPPFPLLFRLFGGWADRCREPRAASPRD